MVVNVHRRRLDADVETIGPLVDRLGGPDDRLWPSDRWPPLHLDGPPEPGAVGGHGPIRYRVQWQEPGAAVWYRFLEPAGFEGGHGFFAHRLDEGTLLEHRLEMRTSGAARLSWPLVFAPLHDALIEDLLWRAARIAGEAPAPPRWSLRVRALRWVLERSRRRGHRR